LLKIRKQVAHPRGYTARQMKAMPAGLQGLDLFNVYQDSFWPVFEPFGVDSLFDPFDFIFIFV
jgi:hypothetical protein